MNRIDLSGIWDYELEEEGAAGEYPGRKLRNTGFALPGSACENKIGKRQIYYEEMTEEAVRAPGEKYEYIGALWLSREVEVPEEVEGKEIRLFLERINMASELWIDGEKIQRQIIELSAPHIYSLTGKLKAGKHVFTLRIDNRNFLNTDTMASGYSVDTQGYWNGIVGRIELQWEEICHIENVQVYPKEEGIRIRLTVVNDIVSPRQRKQASIECRVCSEDGREQLKQTFVTELYNSKQIEYYWYGMEDIEWWDEFHPVLYTLNLRFCCDGTVSESEVIFGMRMISVEEKEIHLNRHRIFLRGTTDCAIFPLTGYPSMEKEEWRRKFNIIKSYGMNHVRFHAWCPPESAFAAADETGLYLSVEMPLWLNRDVCSLEVGEDPIHRIYFSNEARIISKTYGNHPSFLMFSCGNENMGDMELLEDIIMQTKAYDSRRLYTLTTNFDHPILPCEDYLCACEAGGKKIRMQNLQEEVSKDTCLNYNEAAEAVEVPVISFEIGQYCSYPDVDLTEKYTGNMLPVNLDVIRKEMKRKGVYHRRKEYVRVSGRFAVKLYKEEIECALRTKKFGGFELLSLSDYTGQNTAMVGILDMFYDSKGFILPEEFRQFCNEVVPLFLAKRIFQNTEYIEAELDLYDYGKEKIEDPVFEVSVYHEGKLYYRVKTKERKLRIALSELTEAAVLRIHVAVKGYENTWNVFVVPAKEQEAESIIPVISSQEELERVIRAGGRAVAVGELFQDVMEGSFLPVFWSPVFFSSRNPCGAVIHKEHPVFAHFPTEDDSDYQWKILLDHAKAADISKIEGEVFPIVEFIPNFVDNIQASPLFEVEAGKARILFCGFDLEEDDVMVRQLRYSIGEYMKKDFNAPVNVVK